MFGGFRAKPKGNQPNLVLKWRLVQLSLDVFPVAGWALKTHFGTAGSPNFWKLGDLTWAKVCQSDASNPGDMTTSYLESVPFWRRITTGGEHTQFVPANLSTAWDLN